MKYTVITLNTSDEFYNNKYITWYNGNGIVMRTHYTQKLIGAPYKTKEAEIQLLYRGEALVKAVLYSKIVLRTPNENGGDTKILSKKSEELIMNNRCTPEINKGEPNYSLAFPFITNEGVKFENYTYYDEIFYNNRLDIRYIKRNENGDIKNGERSYKKGKVELLYKDYEFFETNRKEITEKETIDRLDMEYMYIPF